MRVSIFFRTFVVQNENNEENIIITSFENQSERVSGGFFLSYSVVLEFDATYNIMK